MMKLALSLLRNESVLMDMHIHLRERELDAVLRKFLINLFVHLIVYIPIIG